MDPDAAPVFAAKALVTQPECQTAARAPLDSQSFAVRCFNLVSTNENDTAYSSVL